MKNIKPDVNIVTNSQKLAEETLELFIGSAEKAIKTKDRFCVALSRKTPRMFFELLGSESRSQSLPWNMIHLFFVDECCRSSNPENNNYDFSTRALIPKVGIPGENVHRFCSTCQSCESMALIYEHTIYKVLGSGENGVPQFDLILLQMGLDGHIASLFPDTYTFFESKRLVWVTHFMDARYTRITLTHPVLYAASQIAVLAPGREKAEILREIFTSEPNITRYPVHALWPVLDKVKWMIDRDAARFLSPSCHIEMNRRGSAF